MGRSKNHKLSKWGASKKKPASSTKSKTTKSKAAAKSKTAKSKAAAKSKKAEKKCEKQTARKYLKRNSPPYPANACPLGKIIEGNDGEMWVTKAYKTKNGVVQRWVKMKD